jgi:hypothetical protein
MNRQSFNEWLRQWGYTWAHDEEMVKGFMNSVEAEDLLSDYVSRGLIKRG